MNKTNMYLVIGIALLVLLGAFYFIFADSSKTNETNIAQSASSESQESMNSNNDDAIMHDDSEFSKRYVAYSDTKLAEATKDNGKAVIFFHAAWCPYCKAAERDLQENFSQVPSDVTILKVDYDTATDLKNKYVVTQQDTFVQVDASGKELTKWISGGRGVESLNKNII